MGKRIVIIQGHPDAHGGHLCHALADAYAQGARAAGHELRRVEVARLDFPMLRTKEAWTSGTLPEALRDAQDAIGWAQHVVLVFPLWLGTMPALVKAFLEQVLRPGFAVQTGSGSPWQRALKGRSPRVVGTMGMPASVYRWFYFSHGVRGLERNVLAFCGLGPVRQTLFGMVDGGGKARHETMMAKMRALGRNAR